MPAKPKRKESAAWLDRNLILVMGKGGVGKTTVSEVAARYLASMGRRVYLAHVLQTDSQESTNLSESAPGLWQQTLSTEQCFREYIALKLKIKGLTSLFLGSHMIQYMQKAAPGIREIVLLGKVWHERLNYDHVIVDMPSTGYGLTMLNTPLNFARLFPGGPIYQDANDMTATLSNAKECAVVTVTLAEEMPLQESVELAAALKNMAPSNHPWLVVNRLLRVKEGLKETWVTHGPWLSSIAPHNPLAAAALHIIKRSERSDQCIASLPQSIFADTLEIHEFPHISTQGLSTEVFAP